MINPNELPNQERDETPVLFLRRYFIDLVKGLGLSVAMFLVPIVIGVLLSVAKIDVMTLPFWGPFAVILPSCYLLVTVSVTLSQITDYFLDTWIVTTERIINIEQRGLFNRTVSELRLNQIQDVTSEMEGFLETFLTYGTVYIQTAGERERFVFEDIDNPDEVKVKIINLVAICKRRHGDNSNPEALDA